MNEDFDQSYQVRKAAEDIKDLKENDKEQAKVQEKHDIRIQALEKDNALMKQQLETIVNNTAQTKRILQQAVYGTIASSLIGGVIAILWAQLGG